MSRFRSEVAFVAASIATVLLSMAVLVAYLSSAPSPAIVRLGYLPNVTHALPLYGIANGSFQQALGPTLTLNAKAFNAGPTAMQALLSNQVDLIFVGPSPTLNGLAVAGPDVLRVISGAASGGASFVIQPYLNLTTSADYSGKKFATPEAGNTQDIAMRHYLLTLGHKTLDQGGDVDVINAASSDILSLFRLRQIDGAWVPEPWASRLVLEAAGKVRLDERSLWPDGRFVSAQLVTTTRYLDAHRDIVERFLNATVSVALLFQNPSPAAVGTVNDAIANATGSRLTNSTIDAAFTYLNVTYDPVRSSLATYLTWAQELGYVPADVDTSRLYDLSLLNAILSDRGLPLVT